MVLPDDLRGRVANEAKRRGLKLSPTLRVLVSERVDQIEDAQLLSKAEEWQRAQAWGSWQEVEAGTAREIAESDLEAIFAKPRQVGGRRKR